MSLEIVGWVALVLTQVFWIPNITKILRTRDVEGYSLLAWALMVGGLSCWLIYFASKGDTVGIVANVCGVTGGVITLACIVYWGRGRKKAPHAESSLPAHEVHVDTTSPASTRSIS